MNTSKKNVVMQARHTHVTALLHVYNHTLTFSKLAVNSA